MKIIKKTAEYVILQRRDNRYAVTDVKKKPILGDEKVKILVEAGLLDLKVPEPAPAEAEAAEQEQPEEAKAE